jgi:hypothetical protein
MHQARNQAFVLFGIPSSNRRPNEGHELDAIYSPPRVDQEGHQGVGRVFTHCQVRLQSSMTLYYWQVPLQGHLQLQPVVAIGHPPTTTTREDQHGRERK